MISNGRGRCSGGGASTPLKQSPMTPAHAVKPSITDPWLRGSTFSDACNAGINRFSLSTRPWA